MHKYLKSLVIFFVLNWSGAHAAIEDIHFRGKCVTATTATEAVSQLFQVSVQTLQLDGDDRELAITSVDLGFAKNEPTFLVTNLTPPANRPRWILRKNGETTFCVIFETQWLGADDFQFKRNRFGLVTQIITVTATPPTNQYVKYEIYDLIPKDNIYRLKKCQIATVHKHNTMNRKTVNCALIEH